MWNVEETLLLLLFQPTNPQFSATVIWSIALAENYIQWEA